jgi:hypoxanthine phosphoribosyltransferase
MIKVRDKNFEDYISEDRIHQRVGEMAEQISKDHKGKNLLFISILNGSFMFTADLFRLVDLPARISFLKLSSYVGTESSGKVRKLIGLNEDLSGVSVIVIEDIIDTGRTLDGIINDLKEKGSEDIMVASLLFKPAAYKGNHHIDYIGFEIPNDFVVGYGLDYDGYGRNLRSVYRVQE